MPALTKIPTWLQVYNKDICWKIPNKEKVIYLTFDDGPHPITTPLVLNILEASYVKATFFCTGKNVKEYPEIYERIIKEEHAVGNHSYSHKSGWKLPITEFVADVNKASSFIKSPLFRPPYGRMTFSQFKAIKTQYKIVMWDILSKDYDNKIKDEDVIKNVIKNISKGSIVVMHDNDKTANRMANILVPTIEYLKNKNWIFKTI